MNRVRAGRCDVPNPFDPDRLTRVSLEPADVDAIVFWTRDPRPLMEDLSHLDRSGYSYYFQYTLMCNPQVLDPACPAPGAAIKTFHDLARRVGPERVIWRYDPIVLSNVTPPDFHVEAFARIASALGRSTRRCVISIVDLYRKVETRLRHLADRGLVLHECDEDAVVGLVSAFGRTARENGIELVSCAEELDLRSFGVRPGKCVDDELIERLFGIRVPRRKDPAQRPACRCVVSRDIGAYDSCLFGCRYCYATNSLKAARRRHASHDPGSSSMIARA
jgi:hypothetical protein